MEGDAFDGIGKDSYRQDEPGREDQAVQHLCYAAGVTDSPPPSDPRVGSVLQDRYKILALVASGGMGVVYRGERLQLGRPVAIKFLNPWVAAQRSFLQRFEVEARALSRLSHPNCVSVIDFGVADVPFLVMDFATGRSLRVLIASERLAPGRALGFARQILSGVAHAHAQGIIHRDLKPENIIVGDSPGLIDHVRILDFGLAKLHDGPALTVGMAVGTPSYMAPEHTSGEGAVDARSDIYAVAVLLFEMLTGRKPFVSDQVAQLILMHQREPAPRMSTVAGSASFSDALEAVVAKALAKAPADRFASADDMAAALDATPESAAMRAGATVAAPGAPEATTAVRDPDKIIVDRIDDKTIIDRTMADETILATSRRPGLAAAPRAQPAAVPRWQRIAHALRRPWTRRQLLAAVVSACAAVVFLFAWGIVRRHHKQPAVEAPLPPPPVAVAPAPAATDDLLPMSPDATPGLADAAQLVRLGLHDQAITVVQDIRRNYPRSAYANFLLAVCYFDKLWWSVGLQHAQAAIQADPAYRRSSRLAKLLVHSLVSDSFWDKGAIFIEQQMPEATIPYLEEAAQSDRSPRVRARAAQILAAARQRTLNWPSTRSR